MLFAEAIPDGKGWLGRVINNDQAKGVTVAHRCETNRPTEDLAVLDAVNWAKSQELDIQTDLG